MLSKYERFGFCYDSARSREMPPLFTYSAIVITPFPSAVIT